MKKIILWIVIVAAIIGIGVYFVMDYKRTQEMLHPKFYSGNGRLEATELYIATKIPGMVEKIFIHEGDLVYKGDKLAKIQTNTLEAQEKAIAARIKVKKGELKMAQAEVKLKESVFAGANKEFNRQKQLLSTQATSQARYDAVETEYNKAQFDYAYAKANVEAKTGEIEEQEAELERIREDIKDCTLWATYDGRIQNLLAREGEVLSPGGRVMNLVNLTDSYITFFLPTDIVGKVRLGADVKVIFDARPDRALYAKVTYVDPVAQFTPKSVETRREREKLMFRVKANLNPVMLLKYIDIVKTGLPGVAWIRLDDKADWNECPEKVCRKEPDDEYAKEARKTRGKINSANFREISMKEVREQAKKDKAKQDKNIKAGKQPAASEQAKQNTAK